MPVFSYTALKSGNQKVNGKIEAISLREARESLRKMNLVPTKLEEVIQANKAEKTSTKGKDAEKSQGKKLKIKKLNLKDRIDLTNTLHVLSKTGISLIESLLFIEMNTGNLKIKALCAELRKHVLSGLNLSDSISKYPDIFDPVYIGLIRTGEEAGELDTTLARMTVLLDKQDKLGNKITMTLMYPAFIIVLAVVVTTVMLTLVFPAFKEMYGQMGNKLPWITQTLIDIGVFLKTYWYMIPVMFGAIGYGIYRTFKWSVTRRLIDKYCLEIPVFKTFIQFSNLSNFLAVMKVAFDAGVPIVDGMILANHTVRNMIMQEHLKESSTKIQQGQSLTVALKSTGVIPAIIMMMISTGEQSGQLGELLEHAANYIDVQLDRTIELLNKLFEPFLLIVIGGIVLVLALALYLPLFQSYQNMS